MVNSLIHLFYFCHMVLLMVMSKYFMGSFCCFSIMFIPSKFRFCVMYPCSQCLCDILANNASILKLQLNSTDLGDEVSLYLA